MPSSAEVERPVSHGETTTRSRTACGVSRMASGSISPVSPRVGRRLGCAAPLVIESLQGGRHGGLVDAIGNLEVIGLLVEG